MTTTPDRPLVRDRYEVYDHKAERPLLILSAVFLLVLAAPIIDIHLPAIARTALDLADFAIWAAFAVDYVVRLVLVDGKLHFVRTHLVELAAVGLPALRPLRLLRLFSIGNMLAARSRRNLISHATRLVAASAVTLIFVAAVAVLDAERDAPGGNIKDFGDALWWASCTITTVGYGDTFPVTTEGRGIAVALIVLGIALIGVLTASIAAWFVREVGQAEADVMEPMEVRIMRLEAKLDRLLELQGKGVA